MEYQKISSKFICRFCKEKFEMPKSLYLHLQQAHNAGAGTEAKDNRACPLCSAKCTKYEGYRDHLLYIHGQRNEGQKLTFKCLNDFLVWRSELEKQHNCKYSLQNAPKILSSNDKQYIYQCNRSESKSKEKKNTVVMKTCASVISVIELSGNQQLKVEYWDTHSGHSSPSNPVSKEELVVAVNSVEVDHVIEEYGQCYENTEDYVASEDTNGTFVKSSSESTKKSPNPHVGNLVPSTSAGPSSKVARFNKIDANKKKNTTNSVLYSLASVACGKTPINRKNNTSSTANKAKENSEVNVNSEASAKKDNVEVQSPSKSPGGKVAISSLKHPSQTDAAAVASVSSISTSQATNTGSVNQLPSSHLTNSAFAGQVLLLNPLQEAVNATQNVFSPGQNILFSFGSVGQNILPSGQGTVAIDQKITSEETEILSVEQKIPSSKSSTAKKTIPRRKRKISTSNSTVPVTQSNLNGVAVNAINPAVSSTDVINPPVSSVLLGTLPVGSTFMTLNNNLVSVGNSPGNFLPQNSVILASTVPASTAENKMLSPSLLNLMPKSVISSPKTVSGTSQVFSHAQTIDTSDTAIAVTASPSVREPSLGQSSSLNVVTNNVISFSSPGLNNCKDPVPVSGPTQTVQSLSNQSVIDTLSFSSVPISSTPTISMPTLASQKPGTLYFESGGDIYMLEPLENEVAKDQSSSPEKAVKPVSNKVKEKRIKEPPVSKKSVFSEETETGESIVLKKRTLADEDDSTVLQKLKYYQLEIKYLACQEECKKMKIELAKANLKNSNSQNLETNMDSNTLSEASEHQNEVNKYSRLIKEYENRLENDSSIYTMVRTSVLRGLYSDLEELCEENKQLFNELDNYRKHDKFYKSLRRKLEEEDF